MEDNTQQVCVSDNWEDIAENPTALDEQLEKLRLKKTGQTTAEPKIRILTRNKDNKSDLKSSEIKESIQEQPSPIVLDSTREESLRSQYVPPEPRIKLLARPESNSNASAGGSLMMSNGPKLKTQQQPVKTLEQREKEYMEARMRILGDVQFSDPEEDGEAPSVDPKPGSQTS